MKKFISLLIIVIQIGALQSCRQDDDNEFIIEKTQNKNIGIQENSRDSVAKDTLHSAKPETDSEDGDPPIKNGTHWRIKK